MGLTRLAVPCGDEPSSRRFPAAKIQEHSNSLATIPRLSTDEAAAVWHLDLATSDHDHLRRTADGPVLKLLFPNFFAGLPDPVRRLLTQAELLEKLEKAATSEKPPGAAGVAKLRGRPFGKSR